MSQHEKLLNYFLLKPKDFTYKQLKKLLGYYGYLEKQGSGSRMKFCHNVHRPILIHKPHPGNTIKVCYLIEIEKELRGKGLINGNDDI